MTAAVLGDHHHAAVTAERTGAAAAAMFADLAAVAAAVIILFWLLAYWGCCCHCCTGMDVARKVVILARECGLQLGVEDLSVSTLVPEELAALATPQEYMEQLHKVGLLSVLLDTCVHVYCASSV